MHKDGGERPYYVLTSVSVLNDQKEGNLPLALMTKSTCEMPSPRSLSNQILINGIRSGNETILQHTFSLSAYPIASSIFRDSLLLLSYSSHIVGLKEGTKPSGYFCRMVQSYIPVTQTNYHVKWCVRIITTFLYIHFREVCRHQRLPSSHPELKGQYYMVKNKNTNIRCCSLYTLYCFTHQEFN